MKKLISLFLILALMLSLSFTIISCGEDGEGNENNGTADIPDVPGYKEEEVEILLLGYTEAQAKGFEGSLEEFLALVKGKDGKSPTVSINEEGYWVIDGVVSDVKATGIQGEKGDKGDKGDAGAEGPQGEPGKDGVTPTIEISEDGYWVINGTKTEYKVTGNDGNNGEAGKDGATIQKVEFDEDGRLIITLTDGTVLEPVEIPEKEEHIHSFGDWINYAGNGNVYCEERLFYRICTECKAIEWKSGSYEDHDFTVVTTEPTCQAGGYDTKTCDTCGKVEVCNETPVADHKYKTEYSYNASFHWFDCENCDETDAYAEHTADEEGFCSACSQPLRATEGIAYGISSDGTYAEVLGYSGTATRVIIADTYESLPVKVIYNEAFKNNDNITQVTIPDSVTEIGSYAFSNCSSLTSVTIGNSVETIGEWAFYSCSSLTSVTIPNSVTTIGSYAFQSCSSLTSVTIGNSVTLIGDYAFCDSIKNVYISDIAAWCNISFNWLSTPLRHSGNLYLNGELVTDLVIPEGVTSIGSCTFYNCNSLTSVTIPDSVTSIGNNAFSNCTALKEIYFNATEMRDLIENNYVFSYAGQNGDGIKVVIGKNVTKIPAYLFNPDAMRNDTSIDTKIISIEFEEGSVCESIGSSAFAYCTSLTSVTIPDSVTSIGNNAFYCCNSALYTDYEYGKYVGDKENPYQILIGLTNKNISTYTIHEDTKHIGYGVFENCSRLTSITIPDNVTTIGSSAFYNCYYLTDVYYTSTEEEWAAIVISSGNSELTDATIHYNYNAA